jgi:uncharacterized protein with PIN domain
VILVPQGEFRGDLYHLGEDLGDLVVENRCPQCRRFIARPPADAVRFRLLAAAGGVVLRKVIGYECSKCGPISPAFEWVDAELAKSREAPE